MLLVLQMGRPPRSAVQVGTVRNKQMAAMMKTLLEAEIQIELLKFISTVMVMMMMMMKTMKTMNEIEE